MMTVRNNLKGCTSEVFLTSHQVVTTAMNLPHRHWVAIINDERQLSSFHNRRLQWITRQDSLRL